MTAPDVAARIAAWLDRLEGLHTAAVVQRHNYPSQPRLRVDPEDQSVVEAVWSDGGHMPYVDCFDTESAAAIVAEHNALPALLALARGVAELANTFTELADLNADRADDHDQAERHVDAQYRHGRAVSYLQAATALRDLLADAAPDTGEETA